MLRGHLRLSALTAGRLIRLTDQGCGDVTKVNNVKCTWVPAMREALGAESGLDPFPNERFLLVRVVLTVYEPDRP